MKYGISPCSYDSNSCNIVEIGRKNSDGEKFVVEPAMNWEQGRRRVAELNAENNKKTVETLCVYDETGYRVIRSVESKGKGDGIGRMYKSNKSGWSYEVFPGIV